MQEEKIKLRQKYRLFPDKEQETKFLGFCGATRYLWNFFLSKQIELYDKEKKFIFYNQMCVLLTKEKALIPWLASCHSQVLQQKLKDLDLALKGCFKLKRGFPKFKQKSNFSDSFRYVQGLKFDGNKVFLPKIGWIKYDNHRPLFSVPTSGTIVMEGGKWFISFVVEKECHAPVEIKRAVGLDLGIKEFLVSSDGELVENPRLLDAALHKLKLKQRKLSKKKKGSNSRKKAQKAVNRLHKKITNKRHDFLHQKSRQIVNAYDLIALEDLNVKGMMKNRKLSKAIGQLGWSQFVGYLAYKAKLYGKHIVQIGRFAPSSKTCSACGKKHDLTLSDRTLNCDCGLILDRDLNASINIRNWGIEKFYTAGTAEIKACGESSNGDFKQPFKVSYDSLKQEAISL